MLSGLARSLTVRCLIEGRGAMVAVKMFEALRLDQADDKIINELRMEAQMMERLSNHPSIVKFVGAITQGTPVLRLPSFLCENCCAETQTTYAGDEGAKFALVTEWCPRGSLYDLLVHAPLLSISLRRKAAHSLVSVCLTTCR